MLPVESATKVAEKTLLSSADVSRRAESGPSHPHYSIIRAGRSAPIDLRELWQFRSLLFALAARDLKLRYKQTILGVIWVVLQPLLAAGIFSFVFGKVAKMPSDGVPYFLFSYAGLLGWNLFNNTVTKVAGSLIGNTQLLTKVYFSRLILPLSNVPSALVDFVVGAVMLAIMMAASHVLPSKAVLLLPIWMMTLLALSLGAGLLSCSLSVTYRDVQYILPVFMQLLLYGTPIAYSISAVPEHLRMIYYLNPLSAPMEAFRSCILGTPMPGTGPLLYSLVMALVVQLAGIYAFKQLERTFADVI